MLTSVTEVRFFSRDMYNSSRMTSLSPSPSPSPTPPPRPAASIKAVQRVSVDACGTPIKLSLPPSPQRQIIYDEEDEEDPIRQHSVHLDTIDESPVGTASPTTPRQAHSSAPASSSFQTSLMQVHATHTIELQEQLDASLALIEVLQDRLEETEEIKRLAREVSEENDELKYAVGEMERLQAQSEGDEETQASLGTLLKPSSQADTQLKSSPGLMATMRRSVSRSRN